MRADYLYGAPGADLALEGEVTLGLARSLPDFPGYVFGREDEPFQSGYQALPAGLVTGPDGTARIALDLPPLGPVSRPVEMTATLRASDGAGSLPHVHGLAIGQGPTQHLAGTGRIKNEQGHCPMVGRSCTLGIQRQALGAQIGHQSAPIGFLLAGNGATG